MNASMLPVPGAFLRSRRSFLPGRQEPCELAEVLAEYRDPVPPVQRHRWMVERKQRQRALMVQSTVHLGDSFPRQKTLEGDPSQGNDHRRFEHFALSVKPRGTRVNLFGSRRAIAPRGCPDHRPRFDDIGHKHLTANQADGGEQVVEHTTRGPHKRLALSVFLPTRSFAYKHDPGRCWPHTRDGAGARPPQRTAPTSPDLVAESR